MSLHRLFLVAILSALGLVACDVNEGPGEEMGEALDETGESIQDAADSTGNAVEDACENVKEGVSDDRDC